MKDKLIVWSIIAGNDGAREENEYITCGHYDGMDIRTTETCNEKNILHNLYEKSNVKAESTDLNQYLYALSMNQGSESHWEDTQTHPYTFIVALNFTPQSDLQERIDKLSTFFEVYHEECKNQAYKHGLRDRETEIKFTYSFYYPLSSSDLVVIFNSNSYIYAQMVFARVFAEKSMKIAYSYTVFSMKFYKEEAGKIEDNILDECLSHAFLYFSVPSFEHFQKLAYTIFEKLELENEKKYLWLLGKHDTELVFTDIETKKFFPLYQKAGLLNRENKLFDQAVYNFQTRIGVYGEIQTGNPESVENNAEKKEPDNEEYSRKLKKIFEDADTYLDSLTFPAKDAFKRTLEEIYHIIGFYEDRKINNYIYDAMVHSFSMFLIELQKAELEEKMNSEFLYQYLDSMNCLIQSYTNSDRKVFQNPKVDRGMFDVPIKLGFFYTAVAYKVIDVLQNIENASNAGQQRDDQIFTVLLRPVIHGNLRTYDSFSEEKPPRNRILIVEIPEEIMFTPKQFIVELIHEIGHYVGDFVRSRDVRREKAISIWTECLGYFLMENKVLKNDLKEQAGELMEIFKKQMGGHIQRVLTDKEQAENMECRNYSKYLCTLLKESTEQVIQEEFSSGVLSNGIIEEYLEKRIEELKKVREGYDEVQTFLTIMRQRMIELLCNHDVKDTLDHIFTLFAELFSDITFIKLLDMGLDEYLNYTTPVENQSKESEYILNVVILSMEWDVEGHKEQLGEGYERLKCMREKKQEDILNNIPKDKRSIRMLYTQSIWNNFIDYCKQCTKRYEDLIRNSKGKDNSTDELRNIFDKSDGNSQAFIGILDSTIRDFWEKSKTFSRRFPTSVKEG